MLCCRLCVDQFWILEVFTAPIVGDVKLFVCFLLNIFFVLAVLYKQHNKQNEVMVMMAKTN
jgi:hypothetical protein